MTKAQRNSISARHCLKMLNRSSKAPLEEKAKFCQYVFDYLQAQRALGVVDNAPLDREAELRLESVFDFQQSLSDLDLLDYLTERIKADDSDKG